jgi:tRNA(fMet)-specific endonuclease VapC
LSIYLLDSNTCVEYLRNRNQNVVQRIKREPTQNIRVCAVVLGELYFGAFKSAGSGKNLALLRKFVAKFNSVPFDDAAAVVYGEERAKLEKSGTRIGPHDMQIAAIALANGLTVVSHNVGEFSRVQGLAVEDWQN